MAGNPMDGFPACSYNFILRLIGVSDKMAIFVLTL